MKRLITLNLQYYRLLFYDNLFASLFYLLLFLQGLKEFNFALLIIAKLIGFISAVAYHSYRYNNVYFYFRNAGMPVRKLYLFAFITDAGITLLFLFIIKVIMLCLS